MMYGTEYFYHPECVAVLLHPYDKTKSEELKSKIGSRESFACTAHKCTVCKKGEEKAVYELQFAVCRRCPKAYHRKFLPSEGVAVGIHSCVLVLHYPLYDNIRWDTWARIFVEKSTIYQPWVWTAGNHEINFAPEIGEYEPFKPYKHRYPVPYRVSQSTSPLWYSIKRASAYIIVFSSYSAYGKYTPQYNWLEQEFNKINRAETPWLIILLLHSLWYNSYNYHYMERESMRVMFEPWFVQNKVDLIFASHVHSYAHWCYKRISKMILYFVYKNVAFGLTLFYYKVYTSFSGEVLYDDL